MIVHEQTPRWRAVALATAALSAACTTPPARGASTPDNDTAVAVPMADPSAAAVPGRPRTERP